MRLRFWLMSLAILVSGCALAAELQVCASNEELAAAIRKSVGENQLSEDVQTRFAQGKPVAVIVWEDVQAYLYFLGRIDNIDNIPAAQLDDAIAFQTLYAFLPAAARRITYYQQGFKMLALTTGEKESKVITWYMDNEKMAEYTASRGNHYKAEQLTKDKLDKLDSMSFHFFDINSTENLGVFLLKGSTKSFLFFGRVPVEKSFVNANHFPVVK